MSNIEWERIKEDHQAVYFNAGLCLDFPNGSYSVEEMEEAVFDMRLSTVEVEEAMRLDFQRMPPEAQGKMFELLEKTDPDNIDYWRETLFRED